MLELGLMIVRNLLEIQILKDVCKISKKFRNRPILINIKVASFKIPTAWT